MNIAYIDVWSWITLNVSRQWESGTEPYSRASHVQCVQCWALEKTALLPACFLHCEWKPAAGMSLASKEGFSAVGYDFSWTQLLLGDSVIWQWVNMSLRDAAWSIMGTVCVMSYQLGVSWHHHGGPSAFPHIQVFIWMGNQINSVFVWTNRRVLITKLQDWILGKHQNVFEKYNSSDKQKSAWLLWFSNMSGCCNFVAQLFKVLHDSYHQSALFYLLERSSLSLRCCCWAV